MSCTTTSGCTSALNAIKKVLCSFFDLFSLRFIDGVTQYRTLSLDSTGYIVNSKATMLEDYEIFNNQPVLAYAKLYNSAVLVNPAVDIPVMTLLVPAESGENITMLKRLFDKGLVIRGTLSVADTAIDSPPASSLIVNIGYRSL